MLIIKICTFGGTRTHAPKWVTDFKSVLYTSFNTGPFIYQYVKEQKNPPLLEMGFKIYYVLNYHTTSL